MTLAPITNNVTDLPASWLPGAIWDHPMPPAKAAAISRAVKNARHRLVLDMGELLEDLCRADDQINPGEFTDGQWTTLAQAARRRRGIMRGGPPSSETKAAVVAKVRRDLAEPYRTKGRG